MIDSFLNLIFPNLCFGCKNTVEKELFKICISCRSNLARHHQNFPFNDPIEKIFLGRLKLEKATAFLKFEKDGRIQQLLHALKYKGVSNVGIGLGELAAQELFAQSFFKDIDLLLPIPIHRKKQQKRGYNQSHYIAQGIANITGLNIDQTSIVKQIHTKSQTKKSRFERHKNVISSFKLMSKQNLKNKHILLVDDVITTGSTIEACGNELKNIPGVQLSLLTIAYTY